MDSLQTTMLGAIGILITGLAWSIVRNVQLNDRHKELKLKVIEGKVDTDISKSKIDFRWQELIQDAYKRQSMELDKLAILIEDGRLKGIQKDHQIEEIERKFKELQGASDDRDRQIIQLKKQLEECYNMTGTTNKVI